jgi:hypothetical protein
MSYVRLHNKVYQNMNGSRVYQLNKILNNKTGLAEFREMLPLPNGIILANPFKVRLTLGRTRARRITNRNRNKAARNIQTAYIRGHTTARNNNTGKRVTRITPTGARIMMRMMREN